MVDNGNQDNMGSVPVRSRTEVQGSKSSVRVYDGTVALMLALMSCFSILPTTPSSHRNEVVRLVKSGRNPEEFGLHAVRIGGATTLAAGGTYRKK